jgi:hypothetical protein
MDEQRRAGESGAASSEYLVIGGIVVAILLVLGSVFRRELTNAITTIACNVASAVSGGNGGCGGGSAGSGQASNSPGELGPSELSPTSEARQRRQALFDEIGAGLKGRGDGYAVVGGSGERLWRVWPDGRSELLPASWKATYPDLKRGDVVYATHDGPVSGTVNAGPDPTAGNYANRILGSSEHSSVRGTINGGGDFI